MKTAVILAGGKGTRLGEDMPPKAMLKINGKTMIDNQLEWLETEKFDAVIICLGHRHQEIKFNTKLKTSLSIEDTPLGTGGAVKKATIQFPSFCSEGVYVLNVDDLAQVNTEHVLTQSKKLGKSIVVTRPLPFSIWVENKIHPQNKSLQHIGHTFLRPDEIMSLPCQGGNPQISSLEQQLGIWSQQNKVETLVHTGTWLTVNDKEQLLNIQKSFSEKSKV